MAQVVSVDERGRIALPKGVREKAGIKAPGRVVVWVRGDGVVEVYSYEKLLEDVRKRIGSKLRGWREEDHEASRVLEELVRRGDS